MEFVFQWIRRESGAYILSVIAAFIHSESGKTVYPAWDLCITLGLLFAVEVWIEIVEKCLHWRFGRSAYGKVKNCLLSYFQKLCFPHILKNSKYIACIEIQSKGGGIVMHIFHHLTKKTPISIYVTFSSLVQHNVATESRNFSLCRVRAVLKRSGVDTEASFIRFDWKKHSRAKTRRRLPDRRHKALALWHASRLLRDHHWASRKDIPWNAHIQEARQQAVNSTLLDIAWSIR